MRPAAGLTASDCVPAVPQQAKPSTCYLIGPPVAVMCGGYHWAYDMGMPRLSCMFCVLTSESAHVLAAQYNPRGAAKRLAAGAKRCGGGVSKGQRVIAVSGSRGRLVLFRLTNAPDARFRL